MNNYEEYFEHHGDRFAAEKGERDAILDRCYELGIGCHDCCYSDDYDYYSDWRWVAFVSFLYYKDFNL